MSSEDLYWSDTYSWAMQQAEALRHRDLEAVDWDNLIEEVEDIGKRHRDQWTGDCENIVEHLLKLQHWRVWEPETGQRWIDTIVHARRRMARIIRRNPGLKSQRPAMLSDAWSDGRSTVVEELATYETGANYGQGFDDACRRWRRQLPAECPYTLEQVESPGWWPVEILRKLEHKVRDPGGASRVND